eukprot:PhM_4_TR17041/c0_g1_i1/m.34802/K14050/RABGGTA; geranylgeranyl transferase type-2 subunit alpha
MHDRERIREQDIAPEARKIVLEKIQRYRDLCDQCHEIKRAGSLDAGKDLEPLTKLLEINPEYYTFYNYRRKILLALFGSAECTADVKKSALVTELEFSTRQIKRDYKSYCTWHHRKWIFVQLRDFPDLLEKVFLKEKAQCEALLGIDERNFHCWGYRRWVLGQLSHADDDEKELAFTESKIGRSFSNYSAWHNRVPLMTRTPTLIPKEVELALQAFYCDPNDQSTFLYMAWLVTQGDVGAGCIDRVVSACEELLELEGDIKWPLWMILQCKLTVLKRQAGKEVEATETKRNVLERLLAVDPRHAGYYRDMLSRA